MEGAWTEVTGEEATLAGDATADRGQRRRSELCELGRLSMTSERDGDRQVIRVFGELDLATADGVEQELRRVEATHAAEILLDLSGLTFMDSTGARLVLQANARSRADSCRLTLLRGPRAVQRVFELCGVAEMLPFVDQR
jgi:anti-sigma B factor antagonist